MLVAFCALVSSHALACSGPGAATAMIAAVWFGRGALTLSVVLTFAIFVRAVRSRASLIWVAGIVAVLMCCLHPGIWFSAYSGDCGSWRTQTSAVMVILHAGLGFFALTPTRR